MRKFIGFEPEKGGEHWMTRIVINIAIDSTRGFVRFKSNKSARKRPVPSGMGRFPFGGDSIQDRQV